MNVARLFKNLYHKNMKYKVLLIGLLSFSLVACGTDSEEDTKPNSVVSEDAGITKVDLNLSNYERYIKCTRHEGFIGPAGWSAYEGWLEFEGLLSIGVYDVTVTYRVDSSTFNFKLDVSGGGKTDYFDRNATCNITNVSGTVTYRL